MLNSHPLKSKQTVNNLQHKHVFRVTMEVPQCGFGTSCQKSGLFWTCFVLWCYQPL